MGNDEKTSLKKVVSAKIHRVLVLIHQAFIQPKQNTEGTPVRKQYWIKTWSEVKELTPSDLEELQDGLQTTIDTLSKLINKIEDLRAKKVRQVAEKHSLDANEWEEDEFLDSSANLPVFREKEHKEHKHKGKNWVVTKPMERPKTTAQICQAVWVVLTNRAISIADKGIAQPKPSPARDALVEKHRLDVLPAILDDKTVTDTLTGKPIMNLYAINREVKETLLWLLAERAKIDERFRKVFIRFLRKEVVAKAHLIEWARKFTPLCNEILQIIENV